MKCFADVSKHDDGQTSSAEQLALAFATPLIAILAAM